MKRFSFICAPRLLTAFATSILFSIQTCSMVFAQDTPRRHLEQTFGLLMIVLDHPWTYAVCALLPLLLFTSLVILRRRHINIQISSPAVVFAYDAALPLLTCFVGLLVATLLSSIIGFYPSGTLAHFVTTNQNIFLAVWSTLFIYFSFFIHATGFEAYKLDKVTEIKAAMPVLTQFVLTSLQIFILAIVSTVILSVVAQKLIFWCSKLFQ